MTGGGSFESGVASMSESSICDNGLFHKVSFSLEDLNV